jgi:hypothetical protein
MGHWATLDVLPGDQMNIFMWCVSKIQAHFCSTCEGSTNLGQESKNDKPTFHLEWLLQKS